MIGDMKFVLSVFESPRPAEMLLYERPPSVERKRTRYWFSKYHVLTDVGSMSTHPPSPPSTSRALVDVFVAVMFPLSCVPPKYAAEPTLCPMPPQNCVV